MLEKTKSPFVTKVYDISSTKASFYGGKVFLVGDALFTLRPNVGMGTTHAAYDCEMLEQVRREDDASAMGESGAQI